MVQRLSIPMDCVPGALQPARRVCAIGTFVGAMLLLSAAGVHAQDRVYSTRPRTAEPVPMQPGHYGVAGGAVAPPAGAVLQPVPIPVPVPVYPGGPPGHHGHPAHPAHPVHPTSPAVQIPPPAGQGQPPPPQRPAHSRAPQR